ncbi:MAG: DUF3567 family protein [Proteobacteria bacterium]|nr:DUF3567 family protein [Pseudomonadota bacterium]HQR04629.1 DUF3567 family protein [Rhodocyclaceae bacterium]
MQILIDNPTLYVIDYPGLDAVELFDKRSRRGGLMQGAIAHRFRSEFMCVLAGGADDDTLSDFADRYDAVLSMPFVCH